MEYTSTPALGFPSDFQPEHLQVETYDRVTLSLSQLCTFLHFFFSRCVMLHNAAIWLGAAALILSKWKAARHSYKASSPCVPLHLFCSTWSYLGSPN